MSDDDWLLSGPTAPEEVRRRYDDWAPEYDGTLASWGYDAPAVAARLLLAHAAPARLLDAGCGTGLVGAALRAAGHRGHVTGGDLSEASLDIARARGVYDELLTVDLQTPLPFADDEFDAATCVGVLSYVPDTDAIWRELARIVSPGGHVVCTQRSDVWDERDCAATLDRLERDGTWTVRLLTAPEPYMPGNPDFGTAIGVRYLVAQSR